jgi:hypothetical protein
MTPAQARAAVADYLGLCRAWPHITAGTPSRRAHPTEAGLLKVTWAGSEDAKDMLRAAFRRATGREETG